MIIKKENLYPSPEEIKVMVHQMYEQLVVVLQKDAGKFEKGLLFNWSDEKIVARIRLRQERQENAIRQRMESRGMNADLMERYCGSLALWPFPEEQLVAQKFFDCEKVQNKDILVFREFQHIKIRAIKVLQENYSNLFAAVLERNTQEKMLKVVVFIGQEKLAIARCLQLNGQ